MKNSEKNSENKESFKLLIVERAKKELEKLPKSEVKKIDTKIQKLSQNPLPYGSQKLAGTQHAYRIRQGDCRILYEVEEKIITIMAIGHRREIYR